MAEHSEFGLKKSMSKMATPKGLSMRVLRMSSRSRDSSMKRRL
mgnify:CR=1 FL=1